MIIRPEPPGCVFLNVPVPDEDFPWINSREETRQVLSVMMASSGNEIMGSTG
jgi:hypothetical protein